MKLKLEEIRDILHNLISEDRLLVLPVSKDENSTDYTQPVTPSGIGINNDNTHILIVVHPEGQDPNFILPKKNKDTKLN